jgi:hypothetical protein
MRKAFGRGQALLVVADLKKTSNEIQATDDKYMKVLQMF